MLGSIPELPAETCKEIKASEGGEAVSSEYWFDSIIPGETVLAYCDMKKEGKLRMKWRSSKLQKVFEIAWSLMLAKQNCTRYLGRIPISHASERKLAHGKMPFVIYSPHLDLFFAVRLNLQWLTVLNVLNITASVNLCWVHCKAWNLVTASLFWLTNVFPPKSQFLLALFLMCPAVSVLWQAWSRLLNSPREVNRQNIILPFGWNSETLDNIHYNVTILPKTWYI